MIFFPIFRPEDPFILSSTRFVQIHNNILRRFWGYHSKSRATALRCSENIFLLYRSTRTHLVSTCLPALRMMVVCYVLVLYRVSSRNSLIFLIVKTPKEKFRLQIKVFCSVGVLQSLSLPSSCFVWSPSKGRLLLCGQAGLRRAGIPWRESLRNSGGVGFWVQVHISMMLNLCLSILYAGMRLCGQLCAFSFSLYQLGLTLHPPKGS